MRISLCFIFIQILTTPAQTQWTWARGSQGAEIKQTFGIECDAAGNLIMAGRFSSEMIFGTGTLTSTAYLDGYVATCDPNGNSGWMQKASGHAQDAYQS